MIDGRGCLLLRLPSKVTTRSLAGGFFGSLLSRLSHLGCLDSGNLYVLKTNASLNFAWGAIPVVEKGKQPL